MCTCVCNSYNMGMSALPDILCKSRVPMLQPLSAILKSAQPSIAPAHSTYILKEAHCDCGILLCQQMLALFSTRTIKGFN